MATILQEGLQQNKKTATSTSTMRALVFRGLNQIKIAHQGVPCRPRSRSGNGLLFDTRGLSRHAPSSGPEMSSIPEIWLQGF